MSKKLDAARRNAARRTEVATKRAGAVTLAEQRATERIRKAEEALLAAEERLRKAKEQAAAIVAKRQQQAAAASQRADEAAERVKAAESKPAKSASPAGTVTTERGQSYPLSKSAVDAVKAATGRKRSGTLSPDGEAAQAMLSALDTDTSGHTGDTFTIAIKGRKTQLVFRVVSDGLAFNTVSAAVAIAA